VLPTKTLRTSGVVRAINKGVFIGDLNNRGAAEFIGRIIESGDSFTLVVAPVAAVAVAAAVWAWASGAERR
jgi:hypothetical protein